MNWNVLISQLECVEVGEIFLKMERAIYTKQTVKLRINGELSRELQIKKGMRQECPISLLLFIWTLEILTTKMQEDVRIKGLKIKEEEYKLQAFADDLVFILEESFGLIEAWMEMLKEYGEMAGLRINVQKTKMLTKNMQKEENNQLVEKTSFIQEKRVKYLGIQLTKI